LEYKTILHIVSNKFAPAGRNTVMGTQGVFLHCWPDGKTEQCK